MIAQKIKKVLFNRKMARALLPKRSRNSNKATSGRTLVIAGSKEYMGAAYLCAETAARCGSGYVYLATSAKNFAVQDFPDFIVLDSKNFTIDLDRINAVAVGPGLKVSLKTKKWIQKVKSKQIKSVVLDADALNTLAKYKMKSLPSSWILTPHEGELARLLNVNAKLIKENRQKYLNLAFDKYGCSVLLKGHQTLIRSDKQIYEITSGNASLAKAGTGDVLTGLIAGFMASGLDAIQAACLACYIHGDMADEWIDTKKDILSLRASDLILGLPNYLYRLRRA